MEFCDTSNSRLLSLFTSSVEQLVSRYHARKMNQPLTAMKLQRHLRDWLRGSVRGLAGALLADAVRSTVD